MRFYRALLRAFPRSFRAEYGDEMTKDFARQWQAAHGMAAVPLMLTSILDVTANAIRVHADILRHDVHSSVRSLRRAPGFAMTAIVVAALGIGATTAAFTLADHVLLRPLPFPESDRLMRLWQDHSSRGYGQLEPSPPNFLDWKRQATMFERLEALATSSESLTGRGEAKRVNGVRVTPGTMQMLGRTAALGRILTDADAAATDSPIVISDRFWRASLGGSPDILGQTLTLDEKKFIVVGVMPSDFLFPTRDVDFWRILQFRPDYGDDDRENFYLAVLGRLKHAVTIDQARGELQSIAHGLAAQYPKILDSTGIKIVPWQDQVSQQSRLLLLGLVGASICVLLIACTNLANLLMSRALARRPEFAVRAAIGASTDRLVRQMLTDSAVVALCGGVLGVMLAVAALPLLALLVPTSLPIADVPPVDLRMLLGTLTLTTVTGLTFGLLPALRVCRTADASALKGGVRGGTSRSTERLRSALVVGEIVASVVLIVCVGLLTQALLAVERVNPGFRADNVLTMRTQLPVSRFAETGARLQFYSRVISRIEALPGVSSASYISFLPMVMRGGIWEVLSTHPDPDRPGGFVPLDPNRSYSASLRFVTPRFFATMATPIIKGRDVNDSDTLTTPLVAVVSESFAQRYFPNQDPIGRSFAIGFDARTIIGIVGDIKVRGLERTSEPQVYAPASQQRTLFFYSPKDLVIRANVPVNTLISAVRAVISEAEPDLPITSVQTMDQVVSGETAPRAAQLRVLGGFAVIALLLAAIGIHGLLAFTVTARAREIGVRIALGAKGRDIMWMVMGRSAIMAALGVTIGAALAYAAGRSLQTLLFGVSPGDVSVYGGAITVALLMTLAGSLLPAWRAVRVDPITATRAE